jgi:hypothetical protein
MYQKNNYSALQLNEAPIHSDLISMYRNIQNKRRMAGCAPAANIPVEIFYGIIGTIGVAVMGLASYMVYDAFQEFKMSFKLGRMKQAAVDKALTGVEDIPGSLDRAKLRVAEKIGLDYTLAISQSDKSAAENNGKPYQPEVTILWNSIARQDLEDKLTAFNTQE